MYRFPVSDIDACPLNKTAWEAASVNLNCTRGASRLNRYHCVPNPQKSALKEFCYDKFSGLYEKDNCIYLADSGYLNSESCSTFSHGCPTTPYLGDEIYNYPECLQINTISKCYVAANSCGKAANRDSTPVNISTVVNTTTTNFTWNSTTVDTKQENSTGVHVAGVVAGASVGALLSAVIIVMLIYLYRRNQKQDRVPDDETHTPLTNRLPDDVGPSSFTDGLPDDEGSMPLKGKAPDIDQDQHMILYLFLFVDGCCIGQRVLHDFEKSWLQKLNRIRKLFEMPETKEDYVLEIFRSVDKGSAIDAFLTWDEEDIKVKSKEAKDEIFWSFYKHNLVSSNITKSEHVKDKIRFLLAESPCDILMNYFRVAGYANQEGEKIECLDEEYTDEMIEKFNIDVIALGNKDDQTFLQRVSKKLKIPLEVLVLDEMNLRSYVQQMIKGKERMYCGRCIILGCGGSGKTTLLARLKNESMTAEEIKSLNMESTTGADFEYENIQEAKSYFTRSDTKEIEKSTEHCESDIQDQGGCTSDIADIENSQEAKSNFTRPGSLDRRFSKERIKSTEHPKSDIHDKEGCKSDTADIGYRMPAVGFTAKLSRGNIHLGNDQTIKYDEVVTNHGDGYQKKSGHFVAPYTGLYVISCTMMSMYRNEVSVGIVKNGNIISKVYSNKNSYDQSTQTLILDLKEDDEIWIKRTHCHGGTIHENLGYIIFSGALLALTEDTRYNK